ncbi:hypothetical protein AB0H58_28995 [Nocardia neocaledoniensis]|uniref:hypothetical protein n=1 Tax=Nocardia neocaledoniensis TaxID=236511 RepID=UPI0033DB7932
MEVESTALGREVARKLDILRPVLEPVSWTVYEARFPPGITLDQGAILTAYREQMGYLIESGWAAADVGVDLESLTLPSAMVELYGITDGADATGIELWTSDGWWSKGEIMNGDGHAHRLEEHWLKFGLWGNDCFLVSLTSGEVMFSDQYFWRYNENDSSRVLAPDMLTFVDEYMLGPKCLEFVGDDNDDPSWHAWYSLLQQSGFA